MPELSGVPLRVAVIGAGWAGLSAAICATRKGHHATIFEATKSFGGRARALITSLPDGSSVTLDNGQHILIGAYTETLALMRLVGVDPQKVLLNLPMTLRFPDGLGIRFANGPTPLDALGGILGATGWSWADKWSLLHASLRWRLQGFKCEASQTVADICQALTPRVNEGLIEPLCVSALNTPAAQASASVFLRVLRDALFGVSGGSRLLLPKTDLGALFPEVAARWVQQQGGQLRLAARVEFIEPRHGSWWIQDERYDAVILATSTAGAARLLLDSGPHADSKTAAKMQAWVDVAHGLRFEAITTVYAWAAQAKLPEPMLALRCTGTEPAQFVFDRGQLGSPQGLMAFVVSASTGDRGTLQAQVLAQARTQLGLNLQVVQTVVEKRATFACTPSLVRPQAWIAPGLLACGDYVDGPYPATLEGAVRSGLAAAESVSSCGETRDGISDGILIRE